MKDTAQITHRIHRLAAGSLVLIAALLAPLGAQMDRWEFFPRGNYFEPILLDPAANQLGGSLLAMGEDGRLQPKIYIPINLGVTKMLVRRERSTDDGIEAGFEFTIHTQYEIHDRKQIVLGTYMNADYRVSGLVHWRHGNHTDRFRLFHKSSHLGDEYMIDHQITGRTTNPLNYEQLDVTRSTIVGHQRYYYGAGYNISPFAEREKWAFQLGYFASRPWSGWNGVNAIYGVDVNIFEENRYHPNIKVGLGLELWSSRTNPPRVILEYYYGYLPYSRLEHQMVQLIGAGLYFNTPI